MNAARIIDDQLVLDVIQKYVDDFDARFSPATMRVHINEKGLPPIPPQTKLLRAPQEIVFGAFIRARNSYLIGIYKMLNPPSKLSTFFHEYGHARYKIETNEEDDEGPGLIRSESVAMRSSLLLPDLEGLLEVATISVKMIRSVAKRGGEYQKAFENVSSDPLWLKYAPLAGTT
jgi:hypothetical protein